MVASHSAHSTDLYERLGLPRAATPDDVKRAYRELVRIYPPERAPEEFKRIREAYETLSNGPLRLEYDRKPDPAVDRLLSQAREAMDSEEYAIAERHFKQALVLAPDIYYVRNLLGLCFMYQAKPAEALPQFERLLRIPDAPPAIFGNAGHAYAQLKQFDNAERAFAEAIRRASDNPVEYYLGLADVLVEQDKYDSAVATLETGICADSSVDFKDYRYFMKLLEIRLRQHSNEEVAAVLGVIQSIARDGDQRNIAAWQLGMLSARLIKHEEFAVAGTIAKSARQLQPDDPDYFALQEVARLLERNEFAAVLELVGGHVAFGTGATLQGLGADIRQYCSNHQSSSSATGSVSRAPAPAMEPIGPVVTNKPNRGSLWIGGAIGLILVAAFMYGNLSDLSREAAPIQSVVGIPSSPSTGSSIPSATSSSAVTYGGGAASDPSSLQPAAPYDPCAGVAEFPPQTSEELGRLNVPKGHGRLAIHNGTDDAAVAVLVYLSSGRPYRAIYIRPQGRGYFASVAQGQYKLRFQFGNGWLRARRFCDVRGTSEFEQALSFDERVDPNDGGVFYNTFQVTLHGIAGGTARTRPVADIELP